MPINRQARLAKLKKRAVFLGVANPPAAAESESEPEPEYDPEEIAREAADWQNTTTSQAFPKGGSFGAVFDAFGVGRGRW